MGVSALTSEFVEGSRATADDGSAPGLVILTLILGGILLARIAGLLFATTDLHNEEALYWYWAQNLLPDYVAGQPIPVWLIELTTTICGDSETCIRLPSPIIATASAFLVYVLAHRLYDSQVAFWSAVVYATLPAVSAFAMVATPDTVSSFAWIAALLALAIHLERPTLSTGAALGLLLGAGLLTDTAIVYLPACTALFLMATPAARPALRAPGTWLAAIIAVLFAAPSLGFVNPGRIDILPAWTLSHLNPDATLLFVGLQFVLFGPILFFTLLQSVLFRRNVAPRAPADRFLLFHSIPVLALLLFQVLFFGAKAHWSMPAFPAAAIFVSALLLRRGLRGVLTFSIGIHVAMLAGILCLSVFAERFRELPAFDRLMGWRQFAENLSEAAALSDLNTIVLRGGIVAEATYYLRDTPIEILAFTRRSRTSANDAKRRRRWAYGDPEPILLATSADLSSFGIPIGAADKIGEFPVQTYLKGSGMFTLYRVNPPSEPGAVQ